MRTTLNSGLMFPLFAVHGYSFKTIKPKKNPSLIEFFAIAAVLMATIALSIDVMSPVFWKMASEFGVESNRCYLIIVALFCD